LYVGAQGEPAEGGVKETETKKRTWRIAKRSGKELQRKVHVTSVNGRYLDSMDRKKTGPKSWKKKNQVYSLVRLHFRKVGICHLPEVGRR